MSGGGLEARLGVDRPGGFRLDADLAVSPGRTVALLGPNGAGKSTIVAALAGSLPLDRGVVILGGRVLDDPAEGLWVPAPERRVGVVHQDLLLFPHLDVTANVAFGLRSRGVRRSSAEARAKEWIDRLDLAGLGDRRPAQLSGGQAQRVALARALVTEPDLLVLDEPLSALDATGRVAMRRVLAEHLAAFVGPRVVITHDPVEAFVLADDVVVLEGGRVTQVGTPDEIRRRPLTRYAADLAGLNLVAGTSVGDGRLDTGSFRLVVADPMSPGDVLATIHPRSVAFHRSEPSGSARNTWSTVVLAVEDLGDRVRVVVGDPFPLVGEVTHGAIADLDLRPGGGVWVSVKATEIRVGEAGWAQAGSSPTRSRRGEQGLPGGEGQTHT